LWQPARAAPGLPRRELVHTPLGRPEEQRPAAQVLPEKKPPAAGLDWRMMRFGAR